MHLRPDGSHATIPSRGSSLNYPDPGPHAVLLSVYKPEESFAHVLENHGVYQAVGVIKHDQDPEADPLDFIADVIEDPAATYAMCLVALASARASARRSGSAAGKAVQ